MSSKQITSVADILRLRSKGRHGLDMVDEASHQLEQINNGQCQTRTQLNDYDLSRRTLVKVESTSPPCGMSPNQNNIP
jgi:hypothetical protein